MEIGEKIRLTRKSLGYNQKKFGNIFGVTQQHLSEVETGKSNPGKAFVAHLKYRYPDIFADEAEEVTPDLIASVVGVEGTPKKVVGFDAVLSEHFEIVKEFKNKVLAKEITESLVTLESENPELLEEVNDYIDLKLRRIGKSPKQSGVVAGKEKSVS